MSLAKLRREAGVPALLSPPHSNPKIEKSLGVGVYTTVLHLLPATMSGQEFCPGRSAGCTASCLHFAGSPAYAANKQLGRMRRSRLLIEHPAQFVELVIAELEAHKRAAARAGMAPAARLNGTSDIPWHRRAPEIFAAHPDIQFYDYTKVVPNIDHLPANYHLTFSLSESNLPRAIEARRRGLNIAAVFAKVPTHYPLGNEVIEVFDGDTTDYRPGDPRGVIVGLKAKGLARRDTSGFVQLAA